MEIKLFYRYKEKDMMTRIKSLEEVCIQPKINNYVQTKMCNELLFIGYYL
jgi:hypothetical protein